MNRHLLTLLGITLLSGSAQATQVIAFKDQARQEAKVSSKAFNRILIAHDRIRQMISHGNFDIETDEMTGQIFLHPSKTKDPIYITLISEKSRTYELKLLVKEMEPATLLIQDESFTKSKSDEEEKEEEKDKSHYLKAPDSKVTPSSAKGTVLPWKDYEVKTYTTMPAPYYRAYQGYEVHALGMHSESTNKVGLFYGLTYRGEDPKDLNAEEFLKPGDQRVSINVNHIRAGQPFYLYVEREKP